MNQTSTDVERLSPYAVDGGCDAYGQMEPDPFGDYVSFEAHEAAIARLTEQVSALTTEKHADAEAIGALEVKLERLSRINSGLCRDFNAMNLHCARLETKLAEAAAERDRLQAAGTFAQGIEAAAKWAKDGYKCQTCGATFLASDAHDVRDCSAGYPSWVRIELDELADTIRALSPTPQADPVSIANSEVEKWQKAFTAQSNKLQAVLDIPGVRETLRSMNIPEVDPVREAALDACKIVSDAAAAGHDQIGALVTHLLSAVEPARRALAQKGE